MNFELDLIKDFNIELSEAQKQQLSTYYEFLIDYNQITNLTRITEKTDVYYKHFYDSLSLTNVLDFKTVNTLCDMGAGAGFPSIPLKIVFPHLNVTIVDSLNKRIVFLTELISKLKIENVELHHMRIEDFAKSHQLTYDVVTARALGHLSLILEMGVPMLKNKGYFIAPKGQHVDIEISETDKALKLLGVVLKKNHHFELPYNYGHRVNILYQKLKHVPGYPRTYSQMTNKPL